MESTVDLLAVTTATASVVVVVVVVVVLPEHVLLVSTAKLYSFY